jgi:hypothetical protein
LNTELAYWYGNVINQGGRRGLPSRDNTKSKKTDEWKRSMMDALEREGILQLKENYRFIDYQRMVDGEITYREIQDFAPQYADLGSLMKDCGMSPCLKDYGLAGMIIRGLVAEFSENKDKYKIYSEDEFYTNEYVRTKTDLYRNFLRESLDIEFKASLVKSGMTVEGQNFKTKEEKDAFVKAIESKRAEMTPPQIDTYMRQDFKTAAVKWAENTLERDFRDFKLHSLEKQEVQDFLTFGRCFREQEMGYQKYGVNTWSPKNTFFAKTVNVRNVEDCEFVGRMHYYSASQLINKWGHKMSYKQQKYVLDKSSSISSSSKISTIGTFESHRDNNFNTLHYTPSPNYYDRRFAIGLEDLTGHALSQTTLQGGNGEDVTFPSFTPRPHHETSHNPQLLSFLRPDLNITDYQFLATEAYFISYEKVGLINYMTPNGVILKEIVTDEILPEFLSENNIKSLYNVSLEEQDFHPKINTVVWTTAPFVYKGIKINNGVSPEENMYFVEKMPFQLKGHRRNIFDTKLPVTGYVGKSILDQIAPHVAKYNFAMNQTYNLLQKEVGTVFLFDMALMPQFIKEEWGDSEDSFLQLMEIAKNTGILPADFTTNASKGIGSSFNQFTAVNLTFTEMLNSRAAIAQSAKQDAFEVIGLTPQRLGTPLAYQTATGVMQSQATSYAQTEYYFSAFSDYMVNTLDTHLSVAQYYHKTGQDSSFLHVASDGEQRFIQVNDPFLSLRDLGVRAESFSHDRRKLETFKQYLLSNNTLGATVLDMAEIWGSDTMRSIIDYQRQLQDKSAKISQERAQMEQGLLQEQATLQEQAAEKAHVRAKELEFIKGDFKLKEEEIGAIGRLGDRDSDSTYLDYLRDVTKTSLNASQQDYNYKVDKEKLLLDKQKHEDTIKLERDKLQTKIKTTHDISKRVRDSDVNKNFRDIN